MSVPVLTAGIPSARTSVENRPPARLGEDPGGWLAVCAPADLRPGRGLSVRVGGVRLALFRTAGDTLHALGDIDPFTGAAVIARGLVGDRDGVPTVASPVHKQVFSLLDGRCLDDDAVRLPAFRVRTGGADVRVGLR